MKKPNRDKLNATPAYFLELTERIGLSQSDLADRVGIAKRRIQYLGHGEREIGGKTEPVAMSYPEQYTLEALAGLHDHWEQAAYTTLLQVEAHLMHNQTGNHAADKRLLTAVHAAIAAKL